VRLEQAGRWQPGGQLGRLLTRTGPAQAVQQSGHAELVVEGDGGSGIAGQQVSDLLARARRQQAGHAKRVIKAGVGNVSGGRFSQ
jgi:hypothetical protein